VSSIEQAAERIVQLLLDPRLRARMGEQAREKVRKNFLLTRYLEQYLDLLGSLEGASRPSRMRRAA
jgi:trehalose synthase